MSRPSHDPSIEFEPFLGGGGKKAPFVSPPGPVDPPLGLHPWVEPFSPERLEDVEQSVWQEPVLDPTMRTSRAGRAWSYATWLRRKRREWSSLRGWMMTLLLAVAAGPFAAASVLLYGQAWFAVDLLFAMVLAPLVQELGKIGPLWWAVEKRPYWFGSRFQILIGTWLATACSVVAFAALAWFSQNLSGGSASTGLDWWGVFGGMQLVTGTLSAIGLIRIWWPAASAGQIPRLEHGYPWFQAAFLVNAAVSVLWL